jgi:FAD/FMN-containing dehydrogenase
MPDRLDRRGFLTTALAGAAVVAFDPFGRGWVTAAAASEGGVAGAVSIPGLDGELVLDPGSLSGAADDYGHIVHRAPVALLRPGSVRDVVTAVQYANRLRIKVAARGQAHTTFGQAQVDGGLVIDINALATIHEVSGGYAVVDAGVRWLDLARAAADRGLTAPVFTDYLDLSVGGTLAAGGIGGATQHYGLQVDNVLALDVVTGDGVLRHCSPTSDRQLFDCVLGGLGQFAVVVRATVRLIQAPTEVRSYQLYYPDLATYLADQRLLLADGRFSSLEGQAQPAASGGWEFFVDAASYYRPPASPDDAALLAGLHFDPTRTVITEYSYLDWVNRLAPTVELLKELGIWYFPHPWINLFVPSSRTGELVSATLADLTVDDTGQGPVLLYPFRTDRLTRPFTMRPGEPVAFLFALLRTAVPPDPAVVARQLAGNRALYEAARAVGAKRYPVGSVPFSPADWRDHYGKQYAAFAAAKTCYDPRHLLAPGQGIFA